MQYKFIFGAGILTVLLVFSTQGAKAEPYGWSPNVDNSWQGPPSHTGPKIEKSPILVLQNFPSLLGAQAAGAVGLRWHKVPGATSYHIYYGLSPKNYIYSARDIGDTDNFTIRFLANRVYYVAIQAKNGYSVSDLSNEFAVRPGRGGNLLAATGFTPVRRNTLGAKETLGTTSQYDSPVEETPQETVQEYTPPSSGLDTTQPTNLGGSQQAPPFTPPPPPPKKPSFWESILRMFGFGR